MEVIMVWLGLDCMYRLLPLSSVVAGATQALRVRAWSVELWGEIPEGSRL